LKWAREHDCPWNKGRTRDAASNAGHEEVARWVDEN